MRAKYCCFCCLVFACLVLFCWLIFACDAFLYARNLFVKKNKQVWNCLDTLIVLYYYGLDECFSFLKIVFDSFRFLADVLNDLVLLFWGKPRFRFWLICLVLQKNSEVFRNSIASRKVNKYSLTCRMTTRNVLNDIYSEPCPLL